MRTSIEVADIFRSAGPTYRATHAGHLSLHQLKVMTAIENCRTAALGGHVEACEDCGHWRIAYNSCRNRHCPKCQGAAARTWLAEREADLLPVGYFHVVFTLPVEVADIAHQNKAVVYDLLFRAAADTMLTIAADPKHLGARVGITAVLHTWGSALTHHPHVHMIVPGGGIALDGTRWISSRPAFLLPVRVLGALFRRLFLTRLLALFDAGKLKMPSEQLGREFFDEGAGASGEHGAAEDECVVVGFGGSGGDDFTATKSAIAQIGADGGQEIGGSRAGIALRDFGRFGVFLLRNRGHLPGDDRRADQQNARGHDRSNQLRIALAP